MKTPLTHRLDRQLRRQKTRIQSDYNTMTAHARQLEIEVGIWKKRAADFGYKPPGYDPKNM